MKYIDVHNHLCWGLDDGSKSLLETKTCLESAVKKHVERIIFTPHYCEKEDEDTGLPELRQRLDECIALTRHYGIQGYSGCEFLLNDHFAKNLHKRQLITLADSNYILCEFDCRSALGDEFAVEERLYELLLAGYIPIIAHIERYFKQHLDFKRIEQWVEMGCYLQINASSITGSFGKTCRRNALKLLQGKACHFIATDAHHDCGRRQIQFDEAYKEALKLCDRDVCEILFYRNPLHVVNHEALETEYHDHKRKRFLNFWDKLAISK